MYSDFDLQCEIATYFMNNKVSSAIQYCYNIIHNNHGQVADEFYIMLFDMLKVQNAKELFDSASEQYHRITGRLPPDWENKQFNKMLSEFNILALNGPINASIIEQLKMFYDSCENNHFGRLDFNGLKLKDSDSLGMNMLLQTMYQLKRLKNAEVLLLGDNVILNFNPQKFMMEKKKQEQESKGEQDNANSAKPIGHSASLSLLAAERKRKNDVLSGEIRKEEMEYQAKLKAIDTKLNELLQQKAGGRNSPIGLNSSRKKGPSVDDEIAELETQKLKLQDSAPILNTNSLLKESFIEKIIKKEYLETSEINDDSDTENINSNKDEVKSQEEIENENLLKEIAKKEQLLMLLKLEILQWNGQEQHYKYLSEEYSKKYKKFSPDYQKEYESVNRVKPQNRIGAFQITNAEESKFNSVSKNTPVIESLNNEIHSHNLEYLMQYLDNIEPSNNPVIFMNLYKTNFFTYDAANKLMLFMQEQKRHERNYELFIKNANSLIKVIFKMSGLSEYVKY